jgi:hypothetical protein
MPNSITAIFIEKSVKVQKTEMEPSPLLPLDLNEAKNISAPPKTTDTKINLARMKIIMTIDRKKIKYYLKTH